MMVVITMMVLLINMVMIVMVCVPASPFVALGGFSYTKQKNQTKSKGTHVYGNELFYKTKHQKEIQNKTSKGTHVWKRIFVLRNMKIKRDTCMETNFLYYLQNKKKSNKIKGETCIWKRTLCMVIGVFVFDRRIKAIA